MCVVICWASFDCFPNKFVHAVIRWSWLFIAIVALFNLSSQPIEFAVIKLIICVGSSFRIARIVIFPNARQYSNAFQRPLIGRTRIRRCTRATNNRCISICSQYFRCSRFSNFRYFAFFIRNVGHIRCNDCAFICLSFSHNASQNRFLCWSGWCCCCIWFWYDLFGANFLKI